MLSAPAYWFEAIKLCIQFVGALIIARLAVKWALKRFQSEKTWERRLHAYISAISAINQLEALVGSWLERVYTKREVSEDHEQKESDAYQEAKKELNDGIIAARILFPDRTSGLLAKLESGLAEASSAQFYEEHLEIQLSALREAKQALIEDGRAVLKLS